MLLAVSSTMGVIFDVVIVALLVIFGLIGFRKGFFKSVLSLFSTLVVIIISVACAGGFANILNKIYDFTGLIADKLHDGIASMGTFYSQVQTGVSGKELISQIPDSTNGFLKKLMSYVLEPLSASDIEGLTVAEIVSGAFASIIMLIICAIVLFILIKIIIAIASRLFDNITRNRVFGAANKLGGLAFGAVKGFLIVLIFTVVLTLLTVIPAVNTKLTPIIQDNTKIARPIYNYTDEFVEKHVIDGKIVQKWIDNLWENKYKDRGTDAPAPEVLPEGTVENPINIPLKSVSEGQFIASFSVDFTTEDTQYYTLSPSGIVQCVFRLTVETEAGFNMYNYTDNVLGEEITDRNSIHDGDEYIIKFTKPDESTNVEVNMLITQNK